MSESRPPLEELDLSIPDMHSTADEVRAGEVLRGLDGVSAVRFVARGALVSYRATSISREQICEVLRHAGFRATTFQDSASGDVGLSSA